MSLTKQIGIVVSLLLLLLLGGVLGLYFLKTQSFYEEKLARDAGEITRTLGLALQTGIEDRNRTKALVDAFFANGNYTLIQLQDLKNANEIYARRKRERFEEVPEWFVRLLELPVPRAEKIVETREGPFLKLTVVTDRSALYGQMYELFLYTAGLFLLFAILGIAVLNLLLGVVRRSLHNIEHQAEGVIHNRFILQKEIPSTPELKSVVVAMNSMVKRVRDLYNRSSEMMRQSQEMLYIDAPTGLFNRRYFQLKLPEYLLSNDTRARGSAAIFRISGIDEANRRIGHKRVDEYLHGFAKILKETAREVHEPLLCRINGSEFAMVLPMFHTVRTEDLAKSVVAKHLLLAEEFGLRERTRLSVGICEYERRIQPARLLGCVDTALSRASLYKEDRVAVCETDGTRHPVAGKEEWRKIFARALKEGRFKPRLLPVYDLKHNREAAYSLTFDLVDEDRLIRYGDYIAAALELGLGEELMRYITEYLANHSFPERGAVAFEMVGEPLRKSDRLFAFEEAVGKIAENLRGPLFVELPEYEMVAMDPVFAERFSDTLKQRGARLGINRFQGERGEYGYLKYSAPAYVKMSVNAFLDLDIASRNSLLTLLGSLDIELVVTDVPASSIEELQASGVRYISHDD